MRVDLVLGSLVVYFFFGEAVGVVVDESVLLHVCDFGFYAGIATASVFEFLESVSHGFVVVAGFGMPAVALVKDSQSSLGFSSLHRFMSCWMVMGWRPVAVESCG